MMECKDALNTAMRAARKDPADTDALLNEAIDTLRKKGISTAAKKSGRVASEGLVVARTSSNKSSATLVEVNSETDFAARNDLFQQLCGSVSEAAIKLTESGESAQAQREFDIAELSSTSCTDPTTPSSSVPVATALTNVVSSLRENVQVRRAAGVRIQPGAGVVGVYMHGAVAGKSEGGVKLGRQAAIVALEVEGGMPKEAEAELQQLANKVAMQVVASTPRYVSRSDVPAESIASERAVLTEQAHAPPIPVPGQVVKKQSKPKDPKQIERMVEGRLNKWLGEISLLDQSFLCAGSNGDEGGKVPSVAQYLTQESKRLCGGKTIHIRAFVRYLVGEGVQSNKSADSFAKEVAEKIAKAQ